MFKFLQRLLGSWKRLAILIVIAIVVFFVTRGGGNGKNNLTATVERGEVNEEVVLAGEVVAKSSAKLTFPGSGKMLSIYVSEGELVTKGQVLGQMDTVALNAALNQARIAWQTAQVTADRVLDDLKGKDGTETFTEKETRTTAESARDRAYEAYVVAQRALADAVFRSPIDGVVSQVGVNTVGSSVTVGTLAFEVIDPDSVYFSVLADQTEVGLVSIGDRVELSLDAFENKIFEGVVDNIGLTPKAGEADIVYEIKVDINRQSDTIPAGRQVADRIRVGMTGDAKFFLDKAENVLYTDPSFVRSDTDGKYVLSDNKGTKTRVEVGLEGEERIEIKSGVSQGQTLYK